MDSSSVGQTDPPVQRPYICFRRVRKWFRERRRFAKPCHSGQQWCHELPSALPYKDSKSSPDRDRLAAIVTKADSGHIEA